MGKFFRGPLIYIIIIVVIILAAQFLGNPGTTTIDELKYTEFLQKVQDEDIKDIAIQDRNIVGRYASSEIPDEVFPQQYDFSATMPTIDQFNKDIAAITGTNNPCLLYTSVRAVGHQDLRNTVFPDGERIPGVQARAEIRFLLQ